MITTVLLIYTIQLGMRFPGEDARQLYPVHLKFVNMNECQTISKTLQSKKGVTIILDCEQSPSGVE